MASNYARATSLENRVEEQIFTFEDLWVGFASPIFRPSMVQIERRLHDRIDRSLAGSLNFMRLVWTISSATGVWGYYGE